MVRNRWLGLLLGLLLLLGMRVDAQTTATAAYNSSKIFAAGPMGGQVNGGNYGQTQTGYILAFDFTGTQLDLALQGYFHVVIDGGSNTNGGGTFDINGTSSAGSYYTVTSGMTDGVNHTVVITSQTSNSSSAYDAGNLVRVTGAAPAINNSSVYPNMVALKLGTGNLMGNQIRDASHVRIDGGIGPNVAGYGDQVIATGSRCYGGAVTFFGNPTAIGVFSIGGYLGGGGVFVAQDGNTPTYISAQSQANGNNLPPGIYPLTNGYNGATHRYELRLSYCSSLNVAWSDIILTGGTLDTTHTLSVRKRCFAYGDSIIAGFNATSGATGIMGAGNYFQDGFYMTTPGDTAFGLILACYRLDLALYACGIPSNTVNQLKDIATVVSNGLPVSYKASELMIVEPGINDLSSNTGFSTDDTAMLNNALALATNPLVKIYRQNIYHNVADDGGGNAILTARRGIIASDVAAINDPRLILLDVTGSQWLTTAKTFDGTHPSAAGESSLADQYTALFSNTSPLFILLRNIFGNVQVLSSGIQ